MAPSNGFEPLNSESESDVLPIRLQGHMAGVAGLEPTNAAVKALCLTILATPLWIMLNNLPKSYHFFLNDEILYDNLHKDKRIYQFLLEELQQILFSFYRW